MEELKQCTKCREYKPATEEYFYKVNGKLGQPCKHCRDEYQKIYREKNLDKSRESQRQWKQRNKERESTKDELWRKNNKKHILEYTKEYQKQHRDKVNEYSKKRRNKNHKINNKEWKYCLDCFNHKCAYCGTTEQDHKEKYRQQLHKEHVIHNGDNTINNCVPSCKGCNSSKRQLDMETWFRSKDFFSEEKLIKIKQWLKEAENLNKSAPIK